MNTIFLSEVIGISAYTLGPVASCRVGRVFTRPSAIAAGVGLVKTRPALQRPGSISDTTKGGTNSMQKLLASFLLVVGFAFQAAAQSQAPPPAGGNSLQLNFGAHYGPAKSASLQIQAEAQYLRAYVEMQKHLAEARLPHADARRLPDPH